MPTPRVCVLRAPGTNCDRETAFAFEKAGGAAERLHLFRLMENPDSLRDFEILCLPGGFSYGDDIGAGVVFASQLRTRLAAAIAEFLQRDTLVLGICNGFQVLLKAGLLPGGADSFRVASDAEPDATLTWNSSGRYTDQWVTLRNCSSTNVFLKDVNLLECPIAHAEGRIVVRDELVLSEWEKQGQIALRYTTASGELSPKKLIPPPANPNGSIWNIAGLGDPTGRVLGLMPHPERYLFATQHPQWTRKQLSGDGAGLKIFENAIGYFE